MMIKNWKLLLLSLFFIALCTSLGFWQLRRADEKNQMLIKFQRKITMSPVTASELNVPNDWNFHKATLTGKFDESHTILLDNKTFNGKVGYEVYTPFYAKDMDTIVLIDRGFIPQGISRDAPLSIPKPPKGTVTIEGLLNFPPKYFSFGEIRASGKTEWPLRVEYINLPELTKIMYKNFFPYVLSLGPDSPAALQVKWQINTIDPNKHKGYAVQWFALALTLFIITIVLSIRDHTRRKGRTKKS